MSNSQMNFQANFILLICELCFSAECKLVMNTLNVFESKIWKMPKMWNNSSSFEA